MEANNWLMGPIGGLTFSSGQPEKIPLTDAQPYRVTNTISDSKGNLLFYTDGHKVWDRTYRMMPHGKLLSDSLTHCLIVPKPGDPNRYYLFSTIVDGWGLPIKAAYYAEVDMCLNKGMGDVVTSHHMLFATPGNRLAAVKHANGMDYWVAFHKWQSDAFYCFLVTSEGVNPNPVISRTGSFLTLTPNATGDGGQMKFSPDGSRLALAIGQEATAEIFDFNDQTGVLSNPVHIPIMYRQNYFTPDYTVGIEFSPNGQLLYLTRDNALLLLQYNLSAGDTPSILRSRTIIIGDTLQHTGDPDYVYSVVREMQLGPDGKLYLQRGSVNRVGLSVIAKPNEQGVACLYQDEVFSWDGKLVTHYTVSPISTFIASYFKEAPTIQYAFDCLSPSVQFSLGYAGVKSRTDLANIHWYFGDEEAGSFNESVELHPSHTFVSSGIHRVRANLTWTDGTTQEIKQLVTIPADVVQGKRYGLGKDTTICPGSTLRLDASHTGGTSTWQDGTTKSYLDVTQPGIYWVHICKDGCSITDSITVSTNDIAGVLGNDTLLCQQKEMILDVSDTGEVIEWQDQSVSSRYTITHPGTYWVKMRKNNCVTTDSLVVTYCREAIDIPNIITPNGDGLNEAFVITGTANEDWSLKILNRYGVEVYQTDAYQNDWTGTHLVDGTYYYYLSQRITNKSYKGWVRIMR